MCHLNWNITWVVALTRTKYKLELIKSDNHSCDNTRDLDLSTLTFYLQGAWLWPWRIIDVDVCC